MSVNKNRKAGAKLKRALKVGIMTGVMATLVVMLIVLLVVVKSKNNSHKKEVAELEKQIVQIKEEAEKAAAEEDVQIQDPAKQLQSNEDDWCLALVNKDYALDKDYEPAMKKLVDDMEVDERIVEEAAQMLKDAKKAGMNMEVVSAYRSYDTQSTYFNSDMQSWVNSGYSLVEAYETTSQSVAYPGHSEHTMGLALDIVSESYQTLDEEQENTDEAQWLKEHCWEYGFILRYPAGTTEITGIVYEPWHYRYVGKEAAKEITEQGITLEEYLGVVEK